MGIERKEGKSKVRVREPKVEVTRAKWTFFQSWFPFEKQTKGNRFCSNNTTFIHISESDASCHLREKTIAQEGGLCL